MKSSVDPNSRSRGILDTLKPRIGVPYRNVTDEDLNKREKIQPYLHAVEQAGAEAVAISLRMTPQEIQAMASSLDGFVLPGSPADVDPERYGAERSPHTAYRDHQREQTDWTLLDHAFAERKPVLAICYGVQLLNVYRGGTLLQDIASELGTPIKHSWTDRANGAPEPSHPVRFVPGSRLAELAGKAEAVVNSSHHQSVRSAANGLRITAHAPDGVVEGLECTGDTNWVIGVQWHPERMTQDPLALALFRELVVQARAASAVGRARR